MRSKRIPHRSVRKARNSIDFDSALDNGFRKRFPLSIGQMRRIKLINGLIKIS